MAETTTIITAAVSATGAAMAGIFGFISAGRKERTAERQQLLGRIQSLEERTDAHDERCDEKIEAAIQRIEGRLRHVEEVSDVFDDG